MEGSLKNEITYLIEKYIYMKFNNDIKIDEIDDLMSNIKEKINLLDLNDCNELYNKYSNHLFAINKNIVYYEQKIIKYYEKQKNYNILIGTYLYSLHCELNKLKEIKVIYQVILKYIKSIMRKKRFNFVLKLVKKM